MKLQIRTELAVLILFFLSSGIILGNGTASSVPNHIHNWEEGYRLGDTIYYICKDCKEQEPVRIVQDSVSSGFCQVSDYNGNFGKPVDMAFKVSVNSERAENISLMYQWFRCKNAKGESPELIPGAVASTFRTDSFLKPEIRFFLCEAKICFSLDRQPFILTMRSEVYGAALTGLPTVYIETESCNTDDIGHEEYVDASFRLVPGPQNSDSAINGKIRIKGRGNFSWIQPKKGYNIRFDKRMNLLGMGKAKKWSLIPNFADKTLLRNWYASYLASNVFSNGDWTPQFRFVDVYLNRVYVGNYALATSITISRSRINIQPIDEITTDLNKDGQLTLADGGYVLEMEVRQDAPVYFNTDHNFALSFYDPDLEHAPEEISKWVQNQIMELEEKVLYAPNSLEPGGNADQIINVASWVNAYLVNEVTKNMDACSHSIFLYFDSDEQRFHMGPVWDFDMTCGNITVGCEPEGFGVQKAKWVQPLLKQDAFRKAVRETWKARRDTLLDSVYTIIPTQAEKIRISAELNNLCWPISDRYGLPEPPGFLERVTWESELDYWTNWLERRIAWLDQQFLGETDDS